MNKSVNKFVKYLEETREKASKSKPSVKIVALGRTIDAIKVKPVELPKSDEELEIDYILPRITMSDEEYFKHMEIFYHFKDLSKYLESAPIYDTDILNIIMYMINRNLKCIDVVNGSTAINDTTLRKIKLPKISSKEISELIKTGRINIILNSDDSNLTPREIYIRDTILAHREQFSTDIKDTIENHLIIKDHYFAKKKEMTEEDVLLIVSALRELTLSDNLCEYIKNILMRSIIKPRKNETSLLEKSGNHANSSSQSSKVSPYSRALEKPKKESEIENSITYKEEKKIYSVIREYYNVPKKELVQEVDYDKMLEIVSLMLKINIDLKSIRAFIRLVITTLEESSINPETKYQTFKEKLSIFLSQEQMEYLDELYEAFQYDNKLWMNEFMEYLNKVLEIVRSYDDYSYELDKAKQLMKVENK